MQSRPAPSPANPASPAEDALTFDLGRVDAGMLPLVGGKAANLGELIRAGLPVPPGFCLTTEAYRRVAGNAEVGAILDALASASAEGTSPGRSTPETTADLAPRARLAVATAPVPGEVLAAIRAAYAGLGSSTPVAVRSSATAEDLPFASFAGQQDTYLNVIGPDAVVDAVRRCWASLWTERAVSYRAANAIEHRGVLLAVVVQRMVDAAVAGVMFTANPVTGRRGEAVIDASPGLGEAVVSGAVNPDRFVVDVSSGAIRNRGLGDKRLIVRALAGGGTEHVELPPGEKEPCLTDAQVRELAALGPPARCG
jgi:pyruvate,water dikinase